MSKRKNIKISDIERMAGLGLTKEQIAHNLGIAASTLYEWQKEPEILEAIKKGRASAIEKVTNKLFDKALGGDTVSIIFWLKNMAPRQWADRQERVVEHRQAQELTRDELVNIAGRGRAGDSAKGRGSRKPH